MDVWTDRHTDKQEDIRKFTPVTGVLCPTGHLPFWTVTHVLLLGNLIRSQTSPQRPKISPHSPKSSPLDKISALSGFISAFLDIQSSNFLWLAVD